jgi:endonuclease/exonuclease/phosphatase family metal-dependent hydrolase
MVYRIHDSVRSRGATQSGGRGQAARSFPAKLILDLMTLNLGLLAVRPWGLRGPSLMPHVDERLAAAPDHLHSTGADIIALQEVYATCHRRFLENSLSEIYPYTAAPRKQLRSVLGSGLMFLSKHPIASAEFVPLRDESIIRNVVSERGCLFITVNIAGFGVLRLINLHLSVGGESQESKKAGENVRQIAEIEQVLATARSFGSIPPILVGDFNCSPIVNREVYARIIEAGFVDAFAAAASKEQKRDAVTWDRTNPLNAVGRHKDSPSQRIDHVFVPSALARTVVPVMSRIAFTKPTVEVARGRAVTLSDHYGLLQRVALNVSNVAARVARPRFICSSAAYASAEPTAPTMHSNLTCTT